MVQDTQSTAKALMWEGREILTGLWLARSQHDDLLRNAHLACCVMKRRRETAEIQAQSSLDKACTAPFHGILHMC